MAYELEEVRISQEIFYYLLEHHELQGDAEDVLYKAYTEQEKIQNLVKSQGELANSTIERYGNVIYLIPKEENNFLGFSKPQLKVALCKSNATDKDYYQLICENVCILKCSFGEYEVVNEDSVYYKYNIPPSLFADFKCLIGDKSDNIPGAAGIGPKYAAELLNQFGSLDSIIENYTEIKRP